MCQVQQFEAGLSGWSSSLSSGGSATFANAATNMHSGTNCLLVTVSNPGTASNSVQIISRSFSASSSDTYVLRFLANTATLDANLGVNLLGTTLDRFHMPDRITLRREYLDWVLFSSQRDLEDKLAAFTNYYNGH
ncbi:MAG: hypothetical protein ABSH48_18375 [Verrucomicrobiota bacterium]|jgi:hypothetical protein